MAPNMPPSEADLKAVEAFVDQIVARGLMSRSSVEIATILHLAHEYRETAQARDSRADRVRIANERAAKLGVPRLEQSRIVEGCMFEEGCSPYMPQSWAHAEKCPRSKW
jgi:hypothetical protein